MYCQRTFIKRASSHEDVNWKQRINLSPADMCPNSTTFRVRRVHITAQTSGESTSEAWSTSASRRKLIGLSQSVTKTKQSWLIKGRREIFPLFRKIFSHWKFLGRRTFMEEHRWLMIFNLPFWPPQALQGTSRVCEWRGSWPNSLQSDQPQVSRKQKLTFPKISCLSKLVPCVFAAMR